MTYKEFAAQEFLIAEAKQKSVRTFIIGLNSSFIRTTLYDNSPKSLAEAFAIAQTIFYDHLHMDRQNMEKVIRPKYSHVKEIPQFNRETPKFNPNFMYEVTEGQNADLRSQTRKPFQQSPEKKTRVDGS